MVIRTTIRTAIPLLRAATVATTPAEIGIQRTTSRLAAQGLLAAAPRPGVAGGTRHDFGTASSPHDPLATQLAKRYGPDGALTDPDGVKPLSPQSRPTSAQATLFQPGSKAAERFEDLVAEAQDRGEVFRTASVGVGWPGHDLAHMAAHLSGHGLASKVIGFDTDASSVQRTQSELRRLQSDQRLDERQPEAFDGIEVQHGDFADRLGQTPAMRGTLHAVTCASTTPYMDDGTLQANLKAAFSALKPGGVAVFDGYGPGHDTGGKAMHLRSAADLAGAAKRAGFEVVDASTQNQSPFETVRVCLFKPESAPPDRSGGV
jgi:SAM-dependent methyltransferase